MASKEKLLVQLYLVRHGETEANRDNILQGHCDYPLTELGLDQAVRRGLSMKDEKWGLVFSSDLYRAFNTTQLILAQQSVDRSTNDSINQTPLLREVCFGVREGLSRSMSVHEATIEVAIRRNISVSEVVDTAESMTSVLERQAEFLIRLKHLYLDAKERYQWDGSEPFKVLCVAHGGFIGHFLRNFLPTLVREKPKIGNCSLSIITVEWPVDDMKCSAEEIELEVKAARNGLHRFTCTAHAEQINMCIA